MRHRPRKSFASQQVNTKPTPPSNTSSHTWLHVHVQGVSQVRRRGKTSQTRRECPKIAKQGKQSPIHVGTGHLAHTSNRTRPICQGANARHMLPNPLLGGCCAQEVFAGGPSCSGRRNTWVAGMRNQVTSGHAPRVPVRNTPAPVNLPGFCDAPFCTVWRGHSTPHCQNTTSFPLNDFAVP